MNFGWGREDLLVSFLLFPFRAPLLFGQGTLILDSFDLVNSYLFSVYKHTEVIHYLILFQIIWPLHAEINCFSGSKYHLYIFIFIDFSSWYTYIMVICAFKSELRVFLLSCLEVFVKMPQWINLLTCGRSSFQNWKGHWSILLHVKFIN